MFHTVAMDLTAAIDRNRTALAEIVAALCVMVGLVAGGTVERLPQAVRLMVLKLLRPAESAARRLIVMAAHGLVLEPQVVRPKAAGGAKAVKGAAKVSARAAFRLCDPHMRFGKDGRPYRRPGRGPRVWTILPDPRIPLFRLPPIAAPVVVTKGTSTDLRLTRRLSAISAALADLPKQARRLVRWRAKRAAMPGFIIRQPLRPGQPPGHRKKPDHEVYVILQDCHWRAWDLSRPNSS